MLSKFFVESLMLSDIPGDKSRMSCNRDPDLCCSQHGRESSILSVAEALTHVSQVGHTASMGSIQGAVILLNAFRYFLLAVLNLGQLTASLQDTHTRTNTLLRRSRTHGYNTVQHSFFQNTDSSSHLRQISHAATHTEKKHQPCY